MNRILVDEGLVRNLGSDPWPWPGARLRIELIVDGVKPVVGRRKGPNHKDLATYRRIEAELEVQHGRKPTLNAVCDLFAVETKRSIATARRWAYRMKSLGYLD